MHEHIAAIIKREGGFVDHPADGGGPTKYGITLGTLSDWLNRKATVEDVKSLTVETASTIYHWMFIERPGFWKIQDSRLRDLLIDCGVNHGPSRSVRLLQRALGLPDDGILGPVTSAAANTTNAKTLYARVVANRARLYGRIITDDPSQAVFAAGWMNRLAEFIEAA